MPGMTIRQYASHRKALGLPGASPSGVFKALRTNRITRDIFGLIDASRADADWVTNTDQTRTGPTVASGPTHDSMAHEKLRVERAKADKAELELAVRAGTLVLAEDALRAFGEQIAAAKAILRGRARTLTEEISRVGGVPRGKMNAVAMAIEQSDESILRELAGATAAPCEPDDQSAPLGADTPTPVGESVPGGITPPDDRDRTPGKDRPQPRRKRGGVDVEGHPPTGEGRPRAQEAGSTPPPPAVDGRHTAGDHP